MKIITTLISILLFASVPLEAEDLQPQNIKAEQTQVEEFKDKIVFGVPPFVSSDYVNRVYQPLFAQMAEMGLFEVELKDIGQSYEDFLINLTTEKFDILVMPGHWALPIIEKMNYQPLMRSRSEFQAVIFTHENSGVNKLQDLKGRKIASLGHLSLASSVLRRVMQAQGISPEKHVEILSQQTIEQVIKVVRSEHADVGVIIELEDRQLDELITGQLKMIAKLSAGPAVILVGESFTDGQKQMIASFLEDFINTEAARGVPEAVSFDGFLPLSISDLERFRESDSTLGRFVQPSGQY